MKLKSRISTSSGDVRVMAAHLTHRGAHHVARPKVLRTRPQAQAGPHRCPSPGWAAERLHHTPAFVQSTRLLLILER